MRSETERSHEQGEASMESRSISILGTSHRLQGAVKAEHIKHIDDASYKRYVEIQLLTEQVDFVFEEATEFGPTVAERLSTEILGIGHYMDIDPHPKNREKFGIPDLGNDYTPIYPSDLNCKDFVQHEHLEGQAKREQLWVNRVKEQSFASALFICGYLHTLSLSFRLATEGFSVAQASVYMPYHKLGI